MPFDAVFARLEELAAGERGATLPASVREDVATTLQELQVMGEELRQQNEELAAANQALEEQRHRYQQRFDLAPEAYLVTDVHGIIQEASRAAALRLGAAKERLVGKALVLLLDRKDRSRVFGFLEEAVKSAPGATVEWEATFAPRRGKRFLANISATLARGPDGSAHAVYLLLHDVTERVRAQEELERQVAERSRELARANDELRRSLGEKEVLLREVHHRVKNNLQVIASLLSLQAAQIQDEAARASFLECQNRVHGIALVHERLYQSPSLSRVDMRPYVGALATDLLRAYGVGAREVTLRHEVAELAMRIEHAIPVGLILNELVSNALKHGFYGRTKGEIVVSMRRLDASHCRLEVSDDGVGLPAAVDPEHATSLGLQLVCLLAQQLDGTLAVTRDHGTRFMVDLAAPEG